MRTLVLGGTGQLGANLVRALLDQGDEVRVLHRHGSSIMMLDGLPIERVVGDMNEGQSLRAACEGVEVVYHAAGYYPEETIPVEVAIGQGLKETTLFLEAVRGARVQRVVYASTLTTIGLSKQVGYPANESCEFSTRYTRNPYLMAKAAMEEKILDAAKQGVPAVVIIPTVFFGPYDKRPTSGTQILMVAKRQMPAYIQGRVNCIDVRDVAIAMIRAAERGRVGERYIVGNWNGTQKELNNLIAHLTDVPPPAIPVPFLLARHGAKLGEWASKTLLRRPPVLPAFFVEVIAHMQHYDCSKALRELEYPQHSITDALEDAVDWFRSNGYLGAKPQGSVNTEGE